VCCSMLQCVAVCCSVLQCAAVCCSVLQSVSVLQHVAVCCSMLQCVAVVAACVLNPPPHTMCFHSNFSTSSSRVILKRELRVSSCLLRNSIFFEKFYSSMHQAAGLVPSPCVSPENSQQRDLVYGKLSMELSFELS